MSPHAVHVRVVTDPACPWSWAAEPKLRRLIWEFGEGIDLRWVMAGMARDIDEAGRNRYLGTWLDVAAESGMPFDPRLWTRGGLSSSYPACQAVVAACEQGSEPAGRYLRRLREGLMYGRRRLDHAEALIAEAGPAGLDVPRFELDLRSNAIVEAFGAHLEEARGLPGGEESAGAADCGERAAEPALPLVSFLSPSGERHAVGGLQPYERYAEAAAAAGASPSAEARPEPLQVIDRFGRCATREIEEMTGRPRVVVEAELWALAREWRLKPVTALTGTLWERA